MSHPHDDPRMKSVLCDTLQPVVTVHSNEWFSLMDRGGYYTIEYRQPQVIVLPVVEDHSIVMVEVKRPVMVDNPLELPAGSAEENELPETAAARELKEETGIVIDALERFIPLPPIAISPNRYPLLPWVFMIELTRNEYESRRQHDSEIAGVVCYPYERIKALMASGEIYISLPMAVISRFLFSR